MALVPVDEARDRLLANVRPIGRTERVRLGEANGRVLAEAITATRTQPGFAASAMDGWAVRAEDLAGDLFGLTVRGEAAAGEGFEGEMATGETVRIFTGAPLPAGSDAVLIQEDAERLDDGRILPRERVAAGRHVRPAGADFSKGDDLVSAGQRLSSGLIALAASGGHGDVPVFERPRVAIIATGDELVAPGEPVGPHQIVASNAYGVLAMAEDAGGLPIDGGIARDDEAAIEAAFQRAVDAGADVIVTIGGASVGDHDLVAPVLKGQGVELDFWKVAMRPGKPLLAGRRGGLTVLGLPGNPASALVTARLFLSPLVERLAGRAAAASLYHYGFLATPMGANGERTDFARATWRLDEHGVAHLTPADRQDSSLLSVLAAADALIVRPPNAPQAAAGTPCRYVAL